MQDQIDSLFGTLKRVADSYESALMSSGPTGIESNYKPQIVSPPIPQLSPRLSGAKRNQGLNSSEHITLTNKPYNLRNHSPAKYPDRSQNRTYQDKLKVLPLALESWLKTNLQTLEHFSVIEHLRFIENIIELSRSYLYKIEIPLFWRPFLEHKRYTAYHMMDFKTMSNFSSLFLISISRFYLIFTYIIEIIMQLFSLDDFCINKSYNNDNRDDFLNFWNSLMISKVKDLFQDVVLRLEHQRPSENDSFYQDYFKFYFTCYLETFKPLLINSSMEYNGNGINNPYGPSSNILFSFGINEYFSKYMVSSWIQLITHRTNLKRNLNAKNIFREQNLTTSSENQNSVTYPSLLNYKMANDSVNYPHYPSFDPRQACFDPLPNGHRHSDQSGLDPETLDIFSSLLNDEGAIIFHDGSGKENLGDNPDINSLYSKGCYSTKSEFSPSTKFGANPKEHKGVLSHSKDNDNFFRKSKNTNSSLDPINSTIFSYPQKIDILRLDPLLSMLYDITYSKSAIMEESVNVPVDFQHLPLIADILSIFGQQTIWKENLELYFQQKLSTVLKGLNSMHFSKQQVLPLFNNISLFVIPFMRMCWGLGKLFYLHNCNISSQLPNCLYANSPSIHKPRCYGILKFCNYFGLLNESVLDGEFDIMIGSLTCSTLKSFVSLRLKQMNQVLYSYPKSIPAIRDLLFCEHIIRISEQNGIVTYYDNSGSLDLSVYLQPYEYLFREDMELDNDTAIHLSLNILQFFSSFGGDVIVIDKLLEPFKKLVSKRNDFEITLFENFENLRLVEKSLINKEVMIQYLEPNQQQASKTYHEILEEDDFMQPLLHETSKEFRKGSKIEPGSLLNYYSSIIGDTQKFSSSYEAYLAKKYLNFRWSNNSILYKLYSYSNPAYLKSISNILKSLDKDKKHIKYIHKLLNQESIQRLLIMIDDIEKSISIKFSPKITNLENETLSCSTLCICSSGYWPEELIPLEYNIEKTSEMLPQAEISCILKDMQTMYNNQEVDRTIEFRYELSFVDLEIDHVVFSLPFSEAMVLIEINNRGSIRLELLKSSLKLLDLTLNTSLQSLIDKGLVIESDFGFCISKNFKNSKFLHSCPETNHSEKRFSNSNVEKQEFYDCKDPEFFSNNIDTLNLNPSTENLKAHLEYNSSELIKYEDSGNEEDTQEFHDKLSAMVFGNDCWDNTADELESVNLSLIDSSDIGSVSDDLNISNQFDANIGLSENLYTYKNIVLEIIKDREKSMSSDSTKTQLKSTPTALILKIINTNYGNHREETLKHEELWKILCWMESKSLIKRRCGNWEIVI